MKKTLFILSAALFVLGSCTKFTKETAPKGLDATVAAPSIEQVAVEEEDSDNAFTVKITPGTGNNYYSFAIVKGSINPDAETLLTLGYAKNCVTVKRTIKEVATDVPLSGSFKASAQADTTISVNKLIPNTEYTVYAVANDANGVLSKVASLSITTTDTEAPSAYDSASKKYTFDASNLEDGTMVVSFDDPVEFTEALEEGTAKFYATYLSANSTHLDDGYTEFDQIFKAPIPVDSLSVSGNKVSIQVPERIPGAAVLITFDEGVVVNGVDLENAELTYGGAYYSNGKPAFYGICARFKTASWKFDRPMIKDENSDKLVRMPADTIIYFQDAAKQAFALTAQNLVEPLFQEEKFNKIVPVAVPQITYTDGNYRQVSYPAKNKFVNVQSDSTLVTYLSEVPDYGSYVALSIAEKSVEDLWGNPCAEFTTVYVDEDKNVQPGNYFFSYGYDLKDFYGTYSLIVDENTIVDDVIIAPREKFENPEYEEYYAERNVAIYNLFKNPPFPALTGSLNSYTNFNTTHYGTFNIHNGILNIEYEYIGEGTLTSYNWEGYVSIKSASGNYDFQQPEAGTLFLQMQIYCVLENLGNVGNIASAELKKTSDDYSVPNGEPEPTATSLKR